MSHFVISSSLNPDSKSRILADQALVSLESRTEAVQSIDLRDYPLPLCDGSSSYGDANVQKLGALFEDTQSVIIATAIYNFDANAALKNLVEFCGRTWSDKPVAFLCAAGGQGSYMSIMSIANSLMLDFRCLIVPRFVYCTSDDFGIDNKPTEIISHRIDEMVEKTLQLAKAVS